MISIDIIIYSLVIIGLVASISPIINILLLFIKDTLTLSKNFAKTGVNKAIEWDKKRINNWMDAWNRGEGNYEYRESDKPTWNKDLMEADYDQDKWDDPFYIPDDK